MSEASQGVRALQGCPGRPLRRPSWSKVDSAGQHGVPKDVLAPNQTLKLTAAAAAERRSLGFTKKD